MRSKFSNVQNQTARKVIERCIRKVTYQDQETQMGVDMFTEERKQYLKQIEDLQLEWNQTNT